MGFDKHRALAVYLEIEMDELEPMAWGDGEYFEGNGGEYRVLTDEEADEACRENIEECLWAFNPEFLTAYIAGGSVGPEALRRLIGDSCEDANPALRALVGDQFGDLVDDACRADGRGHFLNTYDGEENETEDLSFYIYRTN
jgi:hypothetical protein